MIRIEYCKTGERINDFEVEEWVAGLRDGDYSVSTSVPIWAVKLAVVSGRLSASNVVFIYKGKEVPINEYGAMLDWPDGMANAEERYSCKIIQLARDKRKREKECAVKKNPFPITIGAKIKD